MPNGTVKWFNEAKGFGFIQPEDGSKDVFVRINDARLSGRHAGRAMDDRRRPGQPFGGFHGFCTMVQPHPHAGATYKIIVRKDGAFEVEVTLPGVAEPVTITGLRTKLAAERWIARHQAAIAAGAPDKRRSFFRPSKPK